jgi:osmotically-inducible protein OsmY
MVVMKNDLEIQKDLIDQLNWEPFIDSSQIGVSVNNGIVTLRGQVRSFAEKEDAENAAWSAPGVQMVNSMLEIKKPESEDEKSWTEHFACYAD